MQSASPFPGMDPYLEGYLWPDVHNRLINAIAEIIAPQIAPKYVARVESYTVEDDNPKPDMGIIYPDVAILKPGRVEEPAVDYGKKAVATAPDLVVPLTVTVKIPVLQIRDAAKNKLITAIEILSFVNKREPGWQSYHEKRDHLHRSGVHFLEIDLLRRGKRHIWDVITPSPHYLFTLWRAGSEKAEIWGNNLRQPLPILPVPLNSPDPDAVLPLRQALDMIYQRGLYHLSVNYQEDPPVPAFSEEDQQWMRQLAGKK